MIATCDLDGNLTYGNPAFLGKWGFNDPKEFLGRPFWDFWLVKDRLDEIMLALWGDGYWFGESGSGFQRMNIACPRDLLVEALNRLEKAVKAL